MKKLGIVGYGDFTKLLVKHLSLYFEILVSSRDNNQDKLGLDFEFAELSEVASQEYVIISIPAQYYQDVLKEMKPHVKPGSLVIDVASVKVKPVQDMIEYLPEHCSILATHPLFGPASAANGIRGLKIMMYPVRLEDAQYAQIKQMFSDVMGLKIIEKTPEEHDQEMAYVQGLSHYIGRVMQCMEVPDSEMSTNAYEDLVDMKNIQGGDSWDLFKSIMQLNPYAEEVNKEFKKSIQEVDKKLGE